MAEVARRKECARDAAAAAAEADKLRAQYAAAAKTVSEMQAANAGLRAQLRSAQAGGGGADKDSTHAATLEAALARREAEVAELRQVRAMRQCVAGCFAVC
eukprot:66577-Chlamydomonas_euryale.AAC.1